MRNEAEKVSAAAAQTPIAEAAQVLAAAAAQVVSQVAAQMLAAPGGLEAVPHVAADANPDIADGPREVEREKVAGTLASGEPPSAPNQPMPTQPIPIERRSRLTGLLHGAMPAVLGWVLSLGLLFVGAHAALEYRAGIMMAWPPSRRLFLWFGLG